MALRLGDLAPDFKADTTDGPISFHEWLGDSWGVLFSHPKDFTPVCTTELGECARLKPEFDRRGVKVIGLSVDKTDSHSKWAEDIKETQGSALNFPVIADPDHKVAELYDMIHPEISDIFTVRSVFIIGPDKKVKLMITYPASTGRNFDEILRVIDSLQLTAKYSVATPVNWKDGDDVIIVPSMSDEDAKAKFPAGWKAPKALSPHHAATKQDCDHRYGCEERIVNSSPASHLVSAVDLICNQAQSVTELCAFHFSERPSERDINGYESIKLMLVIAVILVA